MTNYLTFVALFLIVILLIGLIRVLRGPTAADRVLSAQLFGTAGVAILMLLAISQQQSSLLNVALVLALLAPLTLITFIHLVRKKP